MAVSERSNFVKERDQVEDNVKVKGVDIKLYLNNGPRNYTLTLDDAPEKQGLDSLHLGLVCLYQAWPPNHRAIVKRGSNNRLNEVEFGRDVLKLTLKTLSVDEGYETISFVESRLEGLPHTKTRPRGLYS